MENRKKLLVAAMLVVFGLAAWTNAQGPIRRMIAGERKASLPVMQTQCVDCPPVVVVTPAAAPAMVPTVAPAQLTAVVLEPAGQDEPAEVASTFRKEFIAAVRASRAAGKITPRQAISLRVASYSPAFMEQAESLCLTQMAFAGVDGDALPMTAAGTIDKTAINWSEFAAFLERIVPIVLMLLEAFGIFA